MKRLDQKWKSQSGASILLALLFFLVCLSVGAVILTAASANAGRLTNLRQQEQDYLTVSSAARMFRDDLEGMRFQVTVTTVTSPFETVTSTEVTGPEGYLAQRVEEDARTVFAGRAASTALTVSVEAFADVSVRFQMAEDYGITVGFWMGDEAKQTHGMQLTLPADAVTSTASYRQEQPYDTGLSDENGTPVIDWYTQTTTVTTTTVTWNEGILTKGAGV